MMTVTKFIILVLTTLTLYILGHNGSVAFAENLTRSGASELVKEVRRRCSDDRDCSSNEYCFSRFPHNRYCTACIDCQSHGRKPGWVTCAKSFEECGECLESHYGYMCGSKRETPSIPTNNVTGGPAPSSTWEHPAVVSTLSVITAVVLFAAVGIFVTSIVRKHGSSYWPWTSKERFRRIVPDPESVIQTPMSSFGDLHKPTAPDAALLSQPAYNPNYRASSDPLTCQVASASPETGNGFKRKQPVFTAQEKIQKAFPFERGHSAGPRTNQALASSGTLPSNTQLETALNDSFTHNPPDDAIPDDLEHANALNEESFDLDPTSIPAVDEPVRRRSDILLPQVPQLVRELEVVGTHQSNSAVSAAAAIRISNFQNEHEIMATISVQASLTFNCPVSWNQEAVSLSELQREGEPIEPLGRYNEHERRFEPYATTTAPPDMMEVEDNPERDETLEDDSSHVVPTKKLL